MPVNSKPWWQSRTLWLNIISAVGLVLEAKYSLIKPLVSPDVYQWLGISIPVANAVLRVMTTTSLTLGSRTSQ